MIFGFISAVLGTNKLNSADVQLNNEQNLIILTNADMSYMVSGQTPGQNLHYLTIRLNPCGLNLPWLIGHL